MNLNHRVGFVSDPFAVYFECLTPNGSHQHPKVGMMLGGNHTGSCYLNTLEDKHGWAYSFAEHGYEVLFPDWPGHGRSGALDLKTLTSEETCEALAALISTVDGPVVLLGPFHGCCLWLADR